MTEQQTILLDEIFFCEVLEEHYAGRYRELCRGWNFAAAVIAWKRLKIYQQRINELSDDRKLLQSLLLEINNSYGQPFIYTSIN